MPRALWPLHRGRPALAIVLPHSVSGQPLQRFLLADTGAGSAFSRFELLLTESDCLDGGGILTTPVPLGGAFTGTFPVYLLRVQVPLLAFDQSVRAVGIPRAPAGFDGIAGFRFLNRFTYGNFGVSAQFGLEV
jgi:hypothetical protein